MLAPEEFNPFAWHVAEQRPAMQLDSNNAGMTELLLGITPPPLAHQLNGGVENVYFRSMRSGDVIASSSSVVDYRERDGRLGRMLLTVTEDRWTNGDDELIKIHRFTLIRY
jgi:hypothetical protein